MTRHLDSRELGALAGAGPPLPEGDLRELVEHLGGCDRCLERFDAVWSTGREPAPGDGPGPDEETSRRIERRLFARIHRSATGGQLAWLATDGLLGVCLALARPLLGPSRSPRE